MRASLATATIVACLATIVVAAYWLEILDPAVWFLLTSVLVFLVGGGLVAALLCHVPFRSSAAPSSGVVSGEMHRGINMAHVPVAGFPGFVVVAGFVFMFWSGLPPFRPIVVGIAIVGCIAGAVLVLIERSHRVASDTPLGLSIHAAEQPDAPDERAPDSKPPARR